MNDIIHPSGMVSGRIRMYQVRPGGNSRAARHSDISEAGRMRTPCMLPGRWSPAGPWYHNDVLYDWGTIVQQLLRGAPNGKPYKIAGMYIEFDNSGADVDPVPVVARGENLTYYNALNTNFPNRDYLRVPIIATDEDTSDLTNFPQNNVAKLFAQTAGTVGVHGLTFSDASNSKVYGGGLVAYPDEGDSAQDLIFSRFYLSAAFQVDKVVGSQIGITWEVTLN